MEYTKITLEIEDQRPRFWQWDTGRRLVVTGLAAGTQIHFHKAGMPSPLTLRVYADGEALVCDVPDELLQAATSFIAYTYITDVHGALTQSSKTFAINERAKPDGYVYTPTEAQTWDQLNDRIDEIHTVLEYAKSSNLFIANAVTLDKSVTSGAEVDNAGYFLSDYMEVKPGEKIAFSCTINGIRAIAKVTVTQYDADKVYIKGQVMSTATLAMSDTTKYIRVHAAQTTVDYSTLCVKAYKDPALTYEEYYDGLRLRIKE